MVDIEGEIYIDRPPEVVFEVVADERNEPRYNPKMSDVSMVSEPPIGPGSRFAATMKSRARTLEMVIELTDVQRPTRLDSVSTVGAMRTVGALTFEPQGGGTLMRWSWSIELRGLAKLAAPVVAWMGRRQEYRIWTGLKTMLEAATSSGEE